MFDEFETQSTTSPLATPDSPFSQSSWAPRFKKYACPKLRSDALWGRRILVLCRVGGGGVGREKSGKTYFENFRTWKWKWIENVCGRDILENGLYSSVLLTQRWEWAIFIGVADTEMGGIPLASRICLRWHGAYARHNCIYIFIHTWVYICINIYIHIYI